MASEPEHGYEPGSLVPFKTRNGLIFLSFVISCLGTMSALEFFSRRYKPGKRGKETWYWAHVSASSLAIGVVGIWCSHWIGIHAIVLGDGSSPLQLHYNGLAVGLSVLVPVSVFFCSLTVLDLSFKKTWARHFALLLLGSLMGMATVLMHLCGYFTIMNYHMEVGHDFVGAEMGLGWASGLAIALSLFKIKSLWMNSFKGRLIGEIVVAIFITAVNHIPSFRARYRLRGQVQSHSSSNNELTVAAYFFTCVALVSLFCLFYWWIYSMKKMFEESSDVTAASVRFDPLGRVMTTRDGFLPSRKIVYQTDRAFLDQDFNDKHPSFSWIWKAANDWESVARWIPSMRKYVDIFNSDPSNRRNNSVFREKFCIAAADLASSFSERLSDFGSLHSVVMESGTENAYCVGKRLCLKTALLRRLHKQADLEANSPRGRVLFFVSVATPNDVVKFKNMGYDFHLPAEVNENIATNLHISLQDMAEHLETLRVSRQSNWRKARTSTYLGVYVLRPYPPGCGGADVVVDKDQTDRLPMVALDGGDLGSKAKNLISEMAGLTMPACYRLLDSYINGQDKTLSSFGRRFQSSIINLRYKVSQSFVAQASLAPKIVSIPASTIQQGTQPVDLVPFVLVLDLHKPNLLNPQSKLRYMSAQLFGCVQQAQLRTPFDFSFNEDVDKEFSTRYAGMMPSETTSEQERHRRLTAHFRTLMATPPMAKVIALRGRRPMSWAGTTRNGSGESGESRMRPLSAFCGAAAVAGSCESAATSPNISNGSAVSPESPNRRSDSQSASSPKKPAESKGPTVAEAVEMTNMSPTPKVYDQHTFVHELSAMAVAAHQQKLHERFSK